MNAFRMTDGGRLDHQYLRTCALFRLLRAGRITVERAKELADRPIRRAQWLRPGWLDNTIEIWARDCAR